MKVVRGQFSKAVVLIDALDEFPETDQRSLINNLKTLAPDIQILVTSRNIYPIREQFQDAACMQIRAREGDVKMALAARIDDHEFLSRVAYEDPDLRDAIIDTINTKTQGMFLVAELHITALSQEDNIRDLREKLENLPSEIADAYDQTVTRINNQKPKQAERAHQVLCWLTHARRPLQVRELQQALAMRATDKTFVHGGETSIDTLISYCMGLVIVDKQESDRQSRKANFSTPHADSTSIVRYVHYTAQEYMERPHTFPHGHQSIAQTCLSILLLSNLDVETCVQATNGEVLNIESRKTLLEIEDTLPIAKYASQHWGDHARLALEANATSSVREQIRKFLQKRSNFIFSTWIAHAYDPESDTIYHPGLTVAHIIAGFGINSLLHEAFKLLDRGEVDVRNSDGETPLHLACQNGHSSSVDTLLKFNADKNALTRLQSSPLSYAASHGHHEIVRRLLEIDADIGPSDILAYATHGGDDTVWKPLVERMGVKGLGRSLEEAAREGSESLIPILLKMMQPPSDYQDWMSQTLLLVADSRSSVSNMEKVALMNLLLENGADPNHEDDTELSYSSTPLYCAADSLEALTLLIEQGALVDYQNSKGRTALHSPHVTPETVDFLLKKGANVNKRDSLGSTPLHTAAAQNSSALRSLLLNHAHVDAQDVYGATPLHLATKGAGTHVDSAITVLLDNAADVDLKNSMGYSALHLVISAGNTTVCEGLLKRSKVVRDQKFVVQLTSFYNSLHKYKQKRQSSRDDEQHSQDFEVRAEFERVVAVQLDSLDERQLEINKDLLQLRWLCQLGLTHAIRRFLEAGANLQAQAIEAMEITFPSYRLFCPDEDGSAATLELLLDYGLPINMRVSTGTPLCQAIIFGSTKAAAMLLGRDADPHIGGIYGSPLMIAACGGRRTREILKLLLDYKVEVNQVFTTRVETLCSGLDLEPSESKFPLDMTALHMCAASENSSKDDICLLVSHGADLEAENEIGETPLILAVRCGRPITTAALLVAGADTKSSFLLTEQDRWPGVYEVDFRKALRSVQEAHAQRIALKDDSS